MSTFLFIYTDDCRNCTGGSTNLTFNFRLDCSNRTCGVSVHDSCGVCRPRNSLKVKNFTDCSGKCFGKANRNKCGFCVGGSTGLPIMKGTYWCFTYDVIKLIIIQIKPNLSQTKCRIKDWNSKNSRTFQILSLYCASFAELVFRWYVIERHRDA